MEVEVKEVGDSVQVWKAKRNVNLDPIANAHARAHPKLKIMTSEKRSTEYPDTIAIELQRCLPPSTPTKAPVRIRNAPVTPYAPSSRTSKGREVCVPL